MKLKLIRFKKWEMKMMKNKIDENNVNKTLKDEK